MSISLVQGALSLMGLSERVGQRRQLEVMVIVVNRPVFPRGSMSWEEGDRGCRKGPILQPTTP